MFYFDCAGEAVVLVLKIFIPIVIVVTVWLLIYNW